MSWTHLHRAMWSSEARSWIDDKGLKSLQYCLNSSSSSPSVCVPRPSGFAISRRAIIKTSSVQRVVQCAAAAAQALPTILWLIQSSLNVGTPLLLCTIIISNDYYPIVVVLASKTLFLLKSHSLPLNATLKAVTYWTQYYTSTFFGNNNNYC